MSRLSDRLRVRVLERDGYRCVYCGRTSAEVPLEADHVIARALGGSDDPTNLVTACRPCNRGKRADRMGLPEWVKPAPLAPPEALVTTRPARVPIRDLVWPVAHGRRRGYPFPDGAWDQWCGGDPVGSGETSAFLPWAVWQASPTWWVGFYSCAAGHRWTACYAITAAWAEVSSFPVSPVRRLPDSGYLKAGFGLKPGDLEGKLREVVYPTTATPAQERALYRRLFGVP